MPRFHRSFPFFIRNPICYERQSALALYFNSDQDIRKYCCISYQHSQKFSNPDKPLLSPLGGGTK